MPCCKWAGVIDMKNSINDDGSPTVVIALEGRLDIRGAEVVDMPLAALSGGKQNVLIDMSDVSFLSSIGMRHLVSATKSLARRGGRLVLINPQDMIVEVLDTAGLTAMIHIAGTEAEARAMVR
jgi:anti-anti-sigma factor